jgi:hypothetical protein
MTADNPAVSSKTEFATELNALLGRAHENDVNVKGGWECRNGDGQPDWDVVVTEIATA